jgi:hypothetical protein
MKEIITHIEINASPQRVWLYQTESYPQWNLPKPEREPNKKRLKVFIQPPGSRGRAFNPVVLKAEPGKELRWLGHLFIPGLFDGEHRLLIEPTRGSTSIFTQSEKFKGLLVPLFWKSLDRNTREGFNQMNEALKRLAER